MFVTSQGNPYSRFQRALETRNLTIIEAAAAELPTIKLDDALVILSLRLLLETPAGLSDVRFALALVERLPACRDALHGLACRRL